MKHLFFTILLAFVVIFPAFAHAQNQVSVAATIDSKVSVALSTVTVSSYETLADPASHSILVTVKLVDNLNAPLPGLNVVLSSTRGSVDIIEDVTKIGSGQGADEMRKAVTDANGLASFRISSFFPGKTTIHIVADQIVSFAPFDLQFDPLPFPTNITVSVPIPGTGKQITLYSPKQQEVSLSNIQQQSKALVNTGTKIEISFWYFLLALLLIILLPISFVYNFLGLRKIRQMEAVALADLQRIEAKEG